MNCSKYQDMTVVEKIDFIGKLNHAAMNDNDVFDMATNLIEVAETKGVFEGVVIVPNTNDMKAV